MRSLPYYLIFLLFIIFTTGCIEPINQTFSKVPPGEWRGVLLIEEDLDLIDTEEEVIIDNTREGEIPFNFEIEYVDENNFIVKFRNAEEEIIVDQISYGRDRATAKDTIIMTFDTYHTYIRAIYEENLMEGNWYIPSKGKDYSIPFKATYGQSYRFFNTKKPPLTDVSGRWKVIFGEGTDHEYPAIGEFQQEDNKLIGTFLTEAGDYRYLEGNIESDKLFLSTFDGAHAYLFEGKLLNENAISGGFRSGKDYTDSWSAIRDENASLRDPFSIAKVNSPEEDISFSFEDLDGNEVSSSDERFKNKVKLLKISGSWCPNCHDEADFLEEYFINHPTNKVEIIEVNFERNDNHDLNKNRLKKYKTKRGDYATILYGGKADRETIKEKLPQLEKLLSYPTLIFIDRKEKIRYVHTGFAGPATSEYESFEKKFDEIINELTNEISE